MMDRQTAVLKDWVVGAFFATVAAYFLKDVFSLSKDIHYLLKYGCIGLVLLGITLNKNKCIFIFIGFCGWLVIYSPTPWPPNIEKSGVIFYSSGCGLIADDVLIESGGKIWRAKGVGVEGDSVERRDTPFSDTSTYLVTVPHLKTSSFCDFSSYVRSFFIRQFEIWAPLERHWLQSFVLGSPIQLDPLTLGALRKFGLLHVVVLSGGHLAIISSFVLFFIRFVPLVCFALRWITMRTWFSFWLTSSIFASAVVFCFSAAVGFSQSVQRALLMFIVLQVFGVYFGSFTKVKTIVGIWIVQCILFPVNVFSVSMLLTWFGSLNLTANRTSHFRKSVFYIFAESLKIQSIFFLISLVVFGAASVWSIAANLVLLPVFSMFLISDFIIMIWGVSNVVTAALIEWQVGFLSWIRNVWSYLSEHHNLVLTFNFDKNQAAISKKLLIAALLVLIAVKIIKNVEKNEKDLS